MSQTTMPFLAHARELRRRIIVSAVATLVLGGVAYAWYGLVLDFLLRPMIALVGQAQSPTGQFLFANTIFEGFLVRVKVSLLAGAVLALPVHAYNTVRFIFPGLTGRERRVVGGALFASFLLLVGGFVYGYDQIIPISVRFLTGNQFIPQPVGLLLSYERSVFFVFQMLLVFMLVFQLPVILILLMMANVVSRATLLRLSRYAIAVIFVVAAIVTPPDVVSQISIAVPMVAMFFLSILIARIFRLGDG